MGTDTQRNVHQTFELLLVCHTMAEPDEIWDASAQPQRLDQEGQRLAVD